MEEVIEIEYENGFVEKYTTAFMVRSDYKVSDRRWKYLLHKIRQDHQEDQWLISVRKQLYFSEECLIWIDQVFDSEISIDLAEYCFVRDQVRQRAERLCLDPADLVPGFCSMTLRELSNLFDKSITTIRRHVVKGSNK